jgi:hypothetical protein
MRPVIDRLVRRVRPAIARDAGCSYKSGWGLGAEGGVRIDDPKQLFCIRPAMEALADEQPSLVLVVRTSTVV